MTHPFTIIRQREARIVRSHLLAHLAIGLGAAAVLLALVLGAA